MGLAKEINGGANAGQSDWAVHLRSRTAAPAPFHNIASEPRQHNSLRQFGEYPSVYYSSLLHDLLFHLSVAPILSTAAATAEKSSLFLELLELPDLVRLQALVLFLPAVQRLLRVIPTWRINSGTGTPISACFKTATICSTENLFPLHSKGPPWALNFARN